ncbi:hypothetical protein CFRA_04145 [Corynebacterium frankenforstense DSM 45800]|uniref:DUF1963 domain-containing protein n=1 Tax=Corynebacterium frankenforstense DSM 45800 TaxID=1437875 RepID=A0A1L7CS03_9CORY|nr:YwqG family protein [Corynebacterium frankenforstense]APT88591.1 hypothetical protein CFRA_04145 [Corynebacterium frankenforstense DSM 45800]
MPAPLPESLAHRFPGLVRPALALRLTAAPPAAGLSQLGGHPYVDAAHPWPLDARGRAMAFLAQVNLGELPALPGFPRRGLMQFFLADDPHHGLFAEGGHLVRFLPDVPAGGASRGGLRGIFGRSRTPAPGAAFPPPEFNPLVDPRVPHGLQGVPVLALPRLGSVEFGGEGNELLPDELVAALTGLARERGLDRVAHAADEWEAYDMAAAALVPPGQLTLGGFPDFVQADPRQSPDQAALLTVRSGGSARVVDWGGDLGVGCFFAASETIEAGDLTATGFSWDV